MRGSVFKDRECWRAEGDSSSRCSGFPTRPHVHLLCSNDTATFLCQSATAPPPALLVPFPALFISKVFIVTDNISLLILLIDLLNTLTPFPSPPQTQNGSSPRRGVSVFSSQTDPTCFPQCLAQNETDRKSFNSFHTYWFASLKAPWGGSPLGSDVEQDGVSTPQEHCWCGSVRPF